MKKPLALDICFRPHYLYCRVGAPEGRLQRKRDAMNRVRMGLTGLAFIFLIVVVTAVGRWPFGAADTPAAPQETLATLGVAPGGDDSAPPAAVPAAPPETPPPATAAPTGPLVIDETDTLTEI